MRRKHRFSLGNCFTEFHIEVCAIKACAVEDTARRYKNRNIHIL
jgi:hypothetical protein